MRMNRILTATCVLAAVSAVAVGAPAVRTVQAEDTAYAVKTEKAQEDISSGVSGSNFDMGVNVSVEEQQKLFKEYENCGIYQKDGLLYYNGKPVRYFVDTGSIVTVNEAGGRTTNFGNICTYANSDGAVIIYTVREQSVNKAQGSIAFGKIEKVEQASSVEEMTGAVSAQSLAKIAEMEYTKGGFAAIRGLIPFLPQEYISVFAKKLADSGSYSEVNSMVEFLSEETVAEIVNNGYQRTGITAVRGLVPFLSEESIVKLARKAADKNDCDTLEQIAFYMSVDPLDKIVKELESKGERIAGIAPYISVNALKEVAQSEYKKAGVSGISELLPIMPKSMVNTFVKEAANNREYTDVEKMAPYAGKKVLKKVAKKMQAEGKSIKGLQDYIN